MTWLGERRKLLPADWRQRRKARLELDGYRCTARIERMLSPNCTLSEQCSNRATDVHHHVHPADHRIESLRSLCAWHHKQHTQAEAQQARGVGVLRRRPRAKHPGLR